MSFEQFREQAVAGMATGGRVRYQGGGRWDDPRPMSPGTRSDYKPGQGHRERPENIDPHKALVSGEDVGAKDWRHVPIHIKDRPISDKFPIDQATIDRQRALRNLQIINAQSLGQPDLDPIPSQPNVWADQYKGTMFEPDPEKDVFGDPPRTTRDEEILEGMIEPKKTVWDDVKQKFVTPTQKALYGVVGNNPKNEKKHIRYLLSQGVNVPQKYLDILDMDDDEDVPFDLFQEFRSWKPTIDPDTLDPMISSGEGVGMLMDFPSYMASGMASKSGVGNFGLITGGDLGNLKDFKNPGTVINPATGLPMTDAKWEQMKRDSGQGASSYDRGPSREKAMEEAQDPCKGPNPPAWCPQTPPPDDETPPPDDNGGTTQGDDPFQFALSLADFNRAYPGGMQTSGTGWSYDPDKEVMIHQFAADGGRMGYAGGGITDLRQGYFIGKLVKGLTKPFKGITRGVKKLMKSPAGKMAMLAALGYGTGMFGTKGYSMFGEGTGKEWLTKLIGQKGLPGVMSTTPWSGDVKSMGPGTTGTTGWLGKLLLKGDAQDKWAFENISPWKAIGLASLAPFLMGGDDEDEGKMYEDWLRERDEWRRKFKPIPYKAQGGRIGYADGYNVDDEEEEVLPHRTALLRAMYKDRMSAQEGGLMDMGGMEKDYRNEGGFVPIGGQERADDVPARLSKNEFVFTADAVRAAGGGDIDAGAEVMENVMENLEQGGQVSEESQGLEGARNMFATAQRLEGVL